MPSRLLCAAPRPRTRLTRRSRSSSSRRRSTVRSYSTPHVSIELINTVLTSQCLDKSVGISVLEQAIEDIKKSIVAAGGDCTVKMAPKAVTENDDAELAALMEKRERENQEVSGDEDESTSDEGGVVEADA
jgi:translation initiation factor 2 subunit 1